MKIERRTGNDERLILTGMITDDKVISSVARHWENGGLFSSRWANLVGDWCVRYYRKYQRAPSTYIEKMAEQWESRNPNQSSVQLVDRFLSGLSQEYERNGHSNSDYVVDRAGEHFNVVRIRKLMESCEEDLDEGQPTKALEKVHQFRQLEMGAGKWLDPFDTENIRRALESSTEPLVKYPGDLGKFFGNSLCRDGFISFLASEKRGKSLTLLDVAFRALRDHCRVAWIEAGDMTQDQVLCRIAVKVTQRPLWKQVIRWPLSITKEPGAETATVVHEERDLEPITLSAATEAAERFLRRQVKGKGRLRLSVNPTGTISALDILEMLHRWAQEDEWSCDVVVIDYADLLAPPSGTSRFDKRDQINETWAQLRRISQELHCLVVTATQADARSYDAPGLSMKNFSEDKRKLSHVTGMVGISQTPPERELGITRLNWLVRREDATFARYVNLAGCLPLASPAIRSTF